jgi:hypothetical protein
VFPNDVHGDYGQDEQCIRFKGTFAAAPVWEESFAGDWNTESKHIIYPNPSVNGELNVVSNSEDGVLREIAVYDGAGRLVERWQAIEEDQTMITMNLNSLKSGLYWISIKGDGFESHQRWVKQ